MSVDFDTFAAQYTPPVEAHARRSDPQTSHDAAASVSMRQSHLEVYKLLRQGPATDEELIRRAEGVVVMSASGIRSRRSELVRAGWARDSGGRGLTAAGRPATIWELVRKPVREREGVSE